MVVVEKVSGGEFYHRGLGRRFSKGDRADVNDELAAYLCEERGDFERADDYHDAEFREVDEGAEQDDGEGDSADEDDEFDVDDFLNRDPTDVDAVAEDILAGEADDHLEAVREAADRVTVEDAVGQRRAELEG